MKNLGYTFIALLIVVSCAGPKKFVNRAYYQIEADQIKESKENLDSALKYEENKQWVKTWYTLGNFHYQIYKKDTAPLNELSETPLIGAYKSYKKTIKLDEKNLYTTKLEMIMPNIKSGLVNKGIEYFEDQPGKAMEYFIYSYNIGQLPLEVFKNTVDSALAYNIGLAAYNSKNYDTAKKYLNKTIELGYQYPGAGIYNILKSIELEQGDTAGALEVLKRGYEAYPDELLLNLTNFYLQNDKTQEALKYLDIAKEKDPENPSFYFAEGTLHERMGNPEKAIKAYKQAVELDPEFFNAYYNLGVLYYNKVVDMLKEADKIKDNKKYNEAKEEAYEELKDALPYMEKAVEIKPNDIQTLETLKTIYYRLEKDDKYERVKKKLEVLKGESE